MTCKKSEGIKIQLLKCARNGCSHVFTDDEYKEVPFSGTLSGADLVCPRCENDSTYTLDHNGILTNPGATIDAHDIEPSRRLGLKMRRRVLAARRRAVA